MLCTLFWLQSDGLFCFLVALPWKSKFPVVVFLVFGGSGIEHMLCEYLYKVMMVP